MSDNYDSKKIKMYSRSAAVRRRPKMYFSECFEEKSLDMLPIEVACHAIDEVFDGKCKSLKILVNSEYFEVQYDAGMSLKIHQIEEGMTEAEIIMTHLFACKNLKKHIHVGNDLCKFGIASVNFAAEWCEVNTISKNKSGVLKFYRGETTLREVQASNGMDQTVIKIRPDKIIFGEIWFTYEGIVSKAKGLSAKLNGFPIDVEKY